MNKLLLALGIGAAGLVIYETAFAKDGATVEINGHTWELVPVKNENANGQPAVGASLTDVYAPKGSWGPHERLLVLRFATVVVPGSPRILSGVGQGVPEAMRVAAMKDLAIKVPGT